jgi:hypothetical protein
MAQWIAISLTAAAMAFGFWRRSIAEAKARGLQDAEIAYMKGELIELRNWSVTPSERDLAAKELDTRFKAQQDLNDLRFSTITRTIDAKLEAILQAVMSFRGGNGR